jgi:hypothetical protein
MPTFYRFTENGIVYNFDDIFVPADIFRSGNLWAWGANGDVQLGVNDANNRTTPVAVFGNNSTWKQVAGGFDFTAGIKTDGTLWMWGDNFRGQLGINSLTDQQTPVTVIGGNSSWKQIALGQDHTVAIKTDGTLWVWGLNASGQLGTNNTTSYSTPVTTFAGRSNWVQVSAGYSETAAISSDGRLWVWGSNIRGQLGTNDTNSRLTPVQTFAGGTNWKQVSVSLSYHMGAIKTDGTLWMWGDNGDGRLGINAPGDRTTPVQTVAGGTNWKQVNCGNGFTAGIKTDGTLWIWGFNQNARLGLNDVISRSTPTQIFGGGNNWKQIECGSSSSVAVKTDGTLWVWGGNASGQLGINSTVDKSTPVTTFLGRSDWKQASIKGSHSIALTYEDYII